MRVLLVVDSLRSGGAERHVVDLARALGGEHHEVTVACSVAGPLASELRDAGLRVEPLLPGLVKRRYSPAFAGALRRLIATGAFDLAHAHIHASATAAAAAVARSDVPLVVTEHTEGPWKSPRDRSISQIAYRRANHVIAVSRAIRRQLVGDYRVPPTKVTYIPNAVRPWSGTRVRPREWGEPGPLIGRVSRLAPEKGVDVFLRAAAIVAGEVPGARFAVIGDGPQAGELRGLAAELGIGRRVRFLGHRPDARAVIASLDLLAVSSLTEGSPLVNLEAMAAGVPIAASACGGIPDQIRDEIDGLLVPPADAPALAHALLRLIREPGLTRRISDAARRRAATEFSYAAMVARVLECYEAADARQRAVAR